MPFEGAGVDSSWRLELPKDFRQFDYETISDVILHISYTARNGGVSGSVKDKISQKWGEKEAAVRLSAMDAGALQRLQNGEEITVVFSDENFPAIARQEGSIIKLEAHCRYKNKNSGDISLNIIHQGESLEANFDSPSEMSLWSTRSEIWTSVSSENGSGDQNSAEPETVLAGYSLSLKIKEGEDASSIQDLLFIHQYTLQTNTNANSEA